jgi:hypothetical protein
VSARCPYPGCRQSFDSPADLDEHLTEATRTDDDAHRPTATYVSVWSEQSRSIWVDTDSDTVGWYRIVEGLSEEEARRIAGQLTVPVKIAPSNATGRQVAMVLYPAPAKKENDQ